jgi:hypothetical protein
MELTGGCTFLAEPPYIPIEKRELRTAAGASA